MTEEQQQRRRMREEIQHMTALCSLTTLQDPAQHAAQHTRGNEHQPAGKQNKRREDWTNVFIAPNDI